MSQSAGMMKSRVRSAHVLPARTTKFLWEENNGKTAKMSDGILHNHRFLCKKALVLHTKKAAGVKRKIQQNSSRIANIKLKEQPDDGVWTDELVRSLQGAGSDQGPRAPQSSSSWPSQPGLSALLSGPGDSWEADSGFSSEASPSASGRSSPCTSAVVALDCEMVGTGPGGRCSELARCSIVDYHGNILYDKYVQPCQPVTDYRTPWSGIQRHHLLRATPFAQAREEILATLDGKVVIGHSIYNDFEVLDIAHPAHMVRDTSTSPLLSRLAGLSCKRSLKVLTRKLLNRKIQGGRRGHDSVEDAQATLDLYKLVEDEWEREVQTALSDGVAPDEPSSSSHYMQDQYWPSEVLSHGQ